MSQPLHHLYDLALHTRDEQGRRAEALRGRLGPVLAAAALGVSLLSGPLAGGARPAGVGGGFATTLVFGGLLVTLLAARSLLGPRQLMSHDIDMSHLMTLLEQEGALDDITTFYTAMIAHLHDDATDNVALLDRLDATFTAMLCGILVILCGLALAALVG